MDFWRAIHVLNSRKWLIMLSVVVTTALTYGATRLTGSKWQASVQLLAPQTSQLTEVYAKSDSSSVSSIPQYGPQAKEASETQASTFDAIVKSKDVLLPALSKIRSRAARHRRRRRPRGSLHRPRNRPLHRCCYQPLQRRPRLASLSRRETRARSSRSACSPGTPPARYRRTRHATFRSIASSASRPSSMRTPAWRCRAASSQAV